MNKLELKALLICEFVMLFFIISEWPQLKSQPLMLASIIPTVIFFPMLIMFNKEKKHKAQTRIDNIDYYKRNRKKYKKRQLQQLKIEELRSMDPFAFERYVRDLLLACGYKKATCTPKSKDEGRDIDAIDQHGRYVQIECKRYAKDNTVGRPKIQILHASTIDKKADRAIFITTGYFSKEAITYANRNNIELVDATRLIEMIDGLNLLEVA